KLREGPVREFQMPLKSNNEINQLRHARKWLCAVMDLSLSRPGCDRVVQRSSRKYFVGAGREVNVSRKGAKRANALHCALRSFAALRDNSSCARIRHIQPLSEIFRKTAEISMAAKLLCPSVRTTGDLNDHQAQETVGPGNRHYRCIVGYRARHGEARGETRGAGGAECEE